MKFDFNKHDDPDLQRIVAARCMQHGKVNEVIICDPTPVVDYKLAIVRTNDDNCLKRLVSTFQAIRLQGAAIIRLDPLRWMLGRDGVLGRH